METPDPNNSSSSGSEVTEDHSEMRIFCGDCDNVVTDTYKEWMDHIISDDHQENIAEKVWTWSEEVNQRSVVITEQPNEKEEFEDLKTSFFTIIWYFSKYGVIGNAFKHLSKKFCVIQFEKRESVDEFLTTDSIVFEGVEVALRLKSSLSPADWFKLCSCSSPEIEMESTSSNLLYSKHIWLTEQIQDMDPDAQLGELLKLLTMSEYDFKKREQVRSELLSIVIEEYPNAKLIGIGDVITGLGDSESALTLSFELPGASYMDSLMENVNRLMISNVTYFKDVELVKGYPTPYINATHCSTDVKVQLWFNYSVRVHSSKLLQFMISLDPRVLPLMILIRYWATYNFQPPNVMDTYTLDLLVIVYLNCMKILPNVAFLQLKTTVKTPLLDDFWNTNFSSDLESISKILSAAREWDIEYTADGKPTAGSVLFLAKHFFRMYAKVDFRITFVCTLLGSFFAKRHMDVEFKDVKLPELLKPYINWSLAQKEEDRFKFDSAMCVQDPFNLGLNTASTVTEVTVLTFQNACYNSVDIFEKMPEDTSDCGSILGITNIIDFVVPREENIPDYQPMTLEQTLEQALEQALEQTLEQTVEQTMEQAAEETLEQTVEQTMEQAAEETLEQTVEQTLEQSLSPSDPISTVASQGGLLQIYTDSLTISNPFQLNALAPLSVIIDDNGDVDYRNLSNQQLGMLAPLMSINTTEFFAPQNNEMAYSGMTRNCMSSSQSLPDISRSLNTVQGMSSSASADGSLETCNYWDNSTSQQEVTTDECWFREWPIIPEAYNTPDTTDYPNENPSGDNVSDAMINYENKKKMSARAKKKLRLAANKMVKLARAISLGVKPSQYTRGRGKRGGLGGYRGRKGKPKNTHSAASSLKK